MSIHALATALDKHRPRRLPGRRWLTRSAVAVVLAEPPQVDVLSVLLMRRAIRAGDPWSGHISFPGGRAQPSDQFARVTATREAQEEVGVTLTDADYLGRLSDVVTRRHERPTPMIVSPYVFRAPRDLSLRVNREGVEALWVPMRFFADPANRGVLRWKVAGMSLTLPSYDYQGRRIWGLTLLMLDELTKLTRDA